MAFDRAAFVQEFAYPITVTVLAAVLYESFDVASCSTARKVYKVPFTKTCDAHAYQCTHRAQMNQIEQLIPFFAAFWSCALAYDATIAGHLGLAWVVLRWLYGLSYRGFSAGLAYLLPFTVPCYVIIITLGSLAAGETLKVLLGEEMHGDWIGWAFPLSTLILASVVYQPILRMQIQNRKKKEDKRGEGKNN